jgi:hypothetical protein
MHVADWMEGVFVQRWSPTSADQPFVQNPAGTVTPEDMLNVIKYRVELQFDGVRYVGSTKNALTEFARCLNVTAYFLKGARMLDNSHERPCLYLSQPGSQMSDRHVLQVGPQMLLVRGNASNRPPGFKVVNIDRCAHLCLAVCDQSSLGRLTCELCFPFAQTERSDRDAQADADREQFSRSRAGVRFGQTKMAQHVLENSFLPAVRDAVVETRGDIVRLSSSVLNGDPQSADQPGTKPFSSAWTPVALNPPETIKFYNALHRNFERRSALRASIVFMQAVGQKRQMLSVREYAKFVEELHATFTNFAISNVRVSQQLVRVVFFVIIHSVYIHTRVQMVSVDLTLEVISRTGEVLLLDGPKLETVLRDFFDPAKVDATGPGSFKWSTRCALGMSQLLACAIVDLQQKPNSTVAPVPQDEEVRRAISRGPVKRLVLYNQAHKQLAVGDKHFQSTDLIGGALGLLSVPPIAEYISQNLALFRASPVLALGAQRVTSPSTLLSQVEKSLSDRVAAKVQSVVGEGPTLALSTLRIEAMIDTRNLEDGRLALLALVLRLSETGAIIRVPYPEYSAATAAVIQHAKFAAALGALGTQQQLAHGLRAYVLPRESLLRTWKESMLMLLVEGRLTWTCAAYRGCRSEMQAYMLSKNLVGAPNGRIVLEPDVASGGMRELLSITDAEAERLVTEIWGPSRIRALIRDPKNQDLVLALLHFWNQVRRSVKDLLSDTPFFGADTALAMSELLTPPLLDLIHEELYAAVVGGRTKREGFPLSPAALALLDRDPAKRTRFTDGTLQIRLAAEPMTTTVDQWITSILTGHLGFRPKAQSGSVLPAKRGGAASAAAAAAVVASNEVGRLAGESTAVSSAVRSLVALFEMAAGEAQTAQAPAAAAAAAAALPADDQRAAVLEVTQTLHRLLPLNVAGVAHASGLFKAAPNASPTMTWRRGAIEFAEPVWSKELHNKLQVPEGQRSAMVAASVMAYGVSGDIMVGSVRLADLAAGFPGFVGGGGEAAAAADGTRRINAYLHFQHRRAERVRVCKYMTPHAFAIFPCRRRRN